jgi:hypothetical protein
MINNTNMGSIVMLWMATIHLGHSKFIHGTIAFISLPLFWYRDYKVRVSSVKVLALWHREQ